MGQLHVFFLPLMAHGHIVPILDLANLFARRGAKATLISTPLNFHVFSRSIEQTKLSGFDIDVRIIEFPASADPSILQGCDKIDFITSSDATLNFARAATLLRQSLEQLVGECRPDCIVADFFYPWATGVAASFNIPRIVFHTTSYFTLCAARNMSLYKPFNGVASDSDAFVLPNLPHEIKFTRKQVPKYDLSENDTGMSVFLETAVASEVECYGVVVNSFYELEPDYVDYYRNDLGRKTWPVGPLSLCNRGIEDKVKRGKEASVEQHDCLKWLDSMEAKSVVYVSFGTLSRFAGDQLKEIAAALEDCGRPFIWVLRKEKDEDWMREGFEERVKGRGFIIRGWVSQVLILDHEAVGGFVTHCGWNSTLEGISAGIPMMTWPLFAEQFYNAKVVTDILRVGISVGANEWNKGAHDGFKREEISGAIRRIMVGEEAEEMRGRAEEMKLKAWRAFEEGGSSSSSLDSLVEGLKSICV